MKSNLVWISCAKSIVLTGARPKGGTYDCEVLLPLALPPDLPPVILRDLGDVVWMWNRKVMWTWIWVCGWRRRWMGEMIKLSGRKVIK